MPVGPNQSSEGNPGGEASQRLGWGKRFKEAKEAVLSRVPGFKPDSSKKELPAPTSPTATPGEKVQTNVSESLEDLGEDFEKRIPSKEELRRFSHAVYKGKISDPAMILRIAEGYRRYAERAKSLGENYLSAEHFAADLEKRAREAARESSEPDESPAPAGRESLKELREMREAHDAREATFLKVLAADRDRDRSASHIELSSGPIVGPAFLNNLPRSGKSVSPPVAEKVPGKVVAEGVLARVGDTSFHLAEGIGEGPVPAAPAVVRAAYRAFTEGNLHDPADIRRLREEVRRYDADAERRSMLPDVDLMLSNLDLRLQESDEAGVPPINIANLPSKPGVKPAAARPAARPVPPPVAGPPAIGPLVRPEGTGSPTPVEKKTWRQKWEERKARKALKRQEEQAQKAAKKKTAAPAKSQPPEKPAALAVPDESQSQVPGQAEARTGIEASLQASSPTPVEKKTWRQKRAEKRIRDAERRAREALERKSEQERKAEEKRVKARQALRAEGARGPQPQASDTEALRGVIDHVRQLRAGDEAIPRSILVEVAELVERGVVRSPEGFDELLDVLPADIPLTGVDRESFDNFRSALGDILSGERDLPQYVPQKKPAVLVEDTSLPEATGPSAHQVGSSAPLESAVPPQPEKKGVRKRISEWWERQQEREHSAGIFGSPLPSSSTPPPSGGAPVSGPSSNEALSTALPTTAPPSQPAAQPPASGPGGVPREPPNQPPLPGNGAPATEPGGAGTPPPTGGTPDEAHATIPLDTREGVQGYIAYAKESQRLKQQERGMIGKMIFGFVAPFTTYVQAWKLKRFSDSYAKDPEHGGKRPILTDALVWSVLENNKYLRGIFKPRVSAEAAASVAATEKAHQAVRTAMEKAARAPSATEKAVMETAGDILKVVMGSVVNPVHADAAKELADLMTKYGLNKDDVEAIQKGIASIFNLGKQAGIEFNRPESFMATVSDQLIYGGLSPDQQDAARKVARMAAGSAILSAGRIAAGIFVPGGGGIIATGIISAVGRASTLGTQGAVYQFNEARKSQVGNANAIRPGAITQVLMRSKLAHWMSVDWDQSKKTYPWQIIRASLVGAGFSYALHGLEHTDLTQGFGGIHIGGGPDLSHGGVPPEAAPLPSGPLHDVVVNGHHYEVPSNVQYSNSGSDAGDLYFVDHGQHIDIGHVNSDGSVTDLNGYHLTPESGAPIPENTADYLHEHNAQPIDPEHHTIVADERQYEAYVSTDENGNVNLTLPPTDNAIGIPQADGSVEMLPFHPGDPGVSVSEDGIMTIHLTPNDPMYQVLIDKDEMHQFFLDKGGNGTMLDGVHNGATTTYVTGHYDNSSGFFEQHSTVNGSASLPDQPTDPSTIITVTHPGAGGLGYPSGEEPGEVFATPAGAAVHDFGNEVADVGGHITDWVFTHPIEDGIILLSAAAGFAMGKGRTDRLFAGSELGLIGGLAFVPGYVIPGYPAAVAAGYLLGRGLGKKRATQPADGTSTGGTGNTGGTDGGTGNRVRPGFPGTKKVEDEVTIQESPIAPASATGGNGGQGNPPATNPPPANPNGGSTNPQTNGNSSTAEELAAAAALGNTGRMTPPPETGGELARETPTFTMVLARVGAMNPDILVAREEVVDLLTREVTDRVELRSALDNLFDNKVDFAPLLTETQKQQLEQIYKGQEGEVSSADKSLLIPIMQALSRGSRPSILVHQAEQLLEEGQSNLSEAQRDSLRSSLTRSQAGRALLYVLDEGIPEEIDDEFLEEVIDVALKTPSGNAPGLQEGDWDILEGIAQAVYGGLDGIPTNAQYEAMQKRYAKVHGTNIPRPATVVPAAIVGQRTPLTNPREEAESADTDVERMESAAVIVSEEEKQQQLDRTINRAYAITYDARTQQKQLDSLLQAASEGQTIDQATIKQSIRNYLRQNRAYLEQVLLLSQRNQFWTIFDNLQAFSGEANMSPEQAAKLRTLLTPIKNVRSYQVIESAERLLDSELFNYERERLTTLLYNSPAGRALLYVRDHGEITKQPTQTELSAIFHFAVPDEYSLGVIDWDEIEGIARAVYGNISNDSYEAVFQAYKRAGGSDIKKFENNPLPTGPKSGPDTPPPPAGAATFGLEDQEKMEAAATITPDHEVAGETEINPDLPLVTSFSRVAKFKLADLDAFAIPDEQKESIRIEIPKITLEKPVEQWLPVNDELRAQVVHQLPFFSHHQEIVPLIYWFSTPENPDQSPTINQGEQIFPPQQNFFTGLAALMGASIDNGGVRGMTQASAALALGNAIVDIYSGRDDLIQNLLRTQTSDARSSNFYVQHDLERATGETLTQESVARVMQMVVTDRNKNVIPKNGSESMIFVLSMHPSGGLTINVPATFTKIQQALPAIQGRLQKGQLTPQDAMVIEFLGNGLYVTKLAEKIAENNKTV